MKKHDTSLKSEGCEALRQMEKFLKGKARLIDAPILRTLQGIAAKGKDPQREFLKLWS